MSNSPERTYGHIACDGGHWVRWMGLLASRCGIHSAYRFARYGERNYITVPFDDLSAVMEYKSRVEYVNADDL